MKLPPIVDSAKTRPLSYDPRTDEFIYYDDVASGKKKIYQPEKLTHEQLLKLAIERQLTNLPSATTVLTGETYTNEQVAKEMRAQTKFGKQMFEADIDYLKFYLSQFPREAFEETDQTLTS
jgi:hypothetical protein